MSPSRRSELHSLLKLAARADEKLGERMDQLQLAPCPAVLLTPGDDVAVLREKFTKANQLLQHFDGMAKWLGRETVLALELQKPSQEAAQLIRSVRTAAEKIREPVSSGDLIGADYLTAKEAIGEAYTAAIEVRARLWVEAWAEVTTALETFGNEDQITAFVLAMSASVELLGLFLAPVRYLRDEYARQLRLPKSGGLAPPSPGGQQQTNVISVPAPDRAPTHWFELIGAIWIVGDETNYGLFPNEKGMQYIRRILESSNRPVPALDLVGGSRVEAVAARSVEELENIENEEDRPGGDSWDPVLDDEAREQYRQAIENITDELEKARERNDQKKIEELTKKYDMIMEQANVALRGEEKSRRLGTAPPAEKARQAVHQALKRAYQKMEKGDPPLSGLVGHFKKAIRPAGCTYVYRPDSPAPPWNFQKNPS